MSMLDSWMNRFHCISNDSNESLYSSKSSAGGLPYGRKAIVILLANRKFSVTLTVLKSGRTVSSTLLRLMGIVDLLSDCAM